MLVLDGCPYMVKAPAHDPDFYDEAMCSWEAMTTRVLWGGAEKAYCDNLSNYHVSTEGGISPWAI